MASIVRKLFMAIFAIALTAPQVMAQEQTVSMASCTLNERFAPQGQAGSFSELIAKADPNSPFGPYLGAYQTTIGEETFRITVLGSRIQNVYTSMPDGGDAQAYRSATITEDGKLTWTSGPGFVYTLTRGEDGVVRMHIKRPNGTEDESILQGCLVGPVNTAEDVQPEG
jgi:hypothetical protein